MVIVGEAQTRGVKSITRRKSLYTEQNGEETYLGGVFLVLSLYEMVPHVSGRSEVSPMERWKTERQRGEREQEVIRGPLNIRNLCPKHE